MGFLVILYAKDQEAVKKAVSSKYRLSSIRPVGVFRYPHKPPTCAGTCAVKTGKKESDWIRADKGELVHKCGKRHPAWRVMLMRGIQNILGHNLLRSAPPSFRTERKT